MNGNTKNMKYANRNPWSSRLSEDAPDPYPIVARVVVAANINYIYGQQYNPAELSPIKNASAEE
jgi:hypothetical protein